MRYIAALIAVLALLLVSGLNALALEGQEPLEPPAADGSPQPMSRSPPRQSPRSRRLPSCL